MRRVWAVLSVGAILVAAACAAPPTASQQTPSGETSPSTEASPSPTPTPSASPAPLAITKLPFHAGEVGLAYAAVTLGAAGGLPPYSWSFASGSLPPGLSLSAGGSVSGSPTKAGSFGFYVRVADSAGGSVSAKATIAVYSALVATESCGTKCVRGKGCTTCGKFGTATGGLGSYAYTIVAGAVSSGMRVSGLSPIGAFPVGSYSLSTASTTFTPRRALPPGDIQAETRR